MVGLLTQLVFFCHGKAWAHAGAIPETIDVNGPYPGDIFGLETTMGYIRGEPEKGFYWLCHETVTTADALITPRYFENSNGVILARVPDRDQARSSEYGLYRSEDGCDWNAVETLEGQDIADLAFDPSDSNHVLAITANAEGVNWLYQSVDAGLSWERQTLQIQDRVFRNILFSKGTDSVWLTAVRFDTDEAWVFQSQDKGTTWTEHVLDVTDAGDMKVYVDVVVADSEDPDRAWVVMGPYLDDQLLETRDGGQSFVPVYAPEADIIDGSQDAEHGLWLVVSGGKVIHSANGDFFQRIDNAPSSMGVTASNGMVYLSHRLASETTAMSSTVDGETFEYIDAISQITGPPECPRDSDSATKCNPLWNALQPEEDTFAPSAPSDLPPAETAPLSDSDQTPQAKGCCSTHNTSPSMALMALLPLWFRKRQTTQKKAPHGNMRRQ